MLHVIAQKLCAQVDIAQFSENIFLISPKSEVHYTISVLRQLFGGPQLTSSNL